MVRLALVLAVLAVSACGGGSTKQGGGSTTPITTSTLDPKSVTAEDVDESIRALPPDRDDPSVRVDATNRTIYVRDCAKAEALTAQGARYGPSPRRPDGSFEPGYGSMCGWGS